MKCWRLWFHEWHYDAGGGLEMRACEKCGLTQMRNLRFQGRWQHYGHTDPAVVQAMPYYHICERKS